MPSRFVCLVILVYWLIAAFFLLTRELLPELTLGYPPDFRTIVAAGQGDPEVRWTIQVMGDSKGSEVLRTVGTAVTGSSGREDGSSELTSRVSLDSEGLFKGTPLASINVGRLEIDSRYNVDNKGNLRTLKFKVTSDEAPDFVLTVDGKVQNGLLVLTFRSKGLEQVRRFPYEPRSVVGNSFGPMDRLPGLHVGQRWETQMVNPITGQVDRVRVEVLRRTLIQWENQPVSPFEVLQTYPPLSSARSWVRTDGVILRQELPLPFVRLILERRKQPDTKTETEASSS